METSSSCYDDLRLSFAIHATNRSFKTASTKSRSQFYSSLILTAIYLRFEWTQFVHISPGHPSEDLCTIRVKTIRTPISRSPKQPLSSEDFSQRFCTFFPLPHPKYMSSAWQLLIHYNNNNNNAMYAKTRMPLVARISISSSLADVFLFFSLDSISRWYGVRQSLILFGYWLTLSLYRPIRVIASPDAKYWETSNKTFISLYVFHLKIFFIFTP